MHPVVSKIPSENPSFGMHEQSKCRRCDSYDQPRLGPQWSLRPENQHLHSPHLQEAGLTGGQ